MASFVLIHGAMHGGWCWERVAQNLLAAGHEVVAPDLPGLGGDRTPNLEVTLEGWGRFVAKLVNAAPDRVILAGHSLGGMAISQAAEFVPERIATLVYVTALMPRNGEAPFQLTARDLHAGDSHALQLIQAADGQSFTVTREEARAAFYGETAPEWAERALSLLVPQPTGVIQESARLSAERYGTVRREYIECLRDKVLPLPIQRKMQAASPCHWRGAIDTDHSPFYSKPDELSSLLLTIAASAID